MICPFLQSFSPMRPVAQIVNWRPTVAIWITLSQILRSFGLVGALMLYRELVAPFRIGGVVSSFRFRKSDLNTKGGLMRLPRQFEHHFPTLRQQPLCVVIVASLWLVGCGSTPIFEDVATSQTGAAGANTLSIPVPPAGSGTAGAELLVAVLGIQANPNTTGPEGWTGVPGFLGFNDATCQSDGQGTACQLAVYYRIAHGSETTAEFSWGGTRRAAGAVLRFSNVDADSPIGAAAPQRGSSDIPTAPVITTTRDGSIALRVAASELDEAGSFLTGSTALTDPPPTERLNMVSFPDAASDPANGCGPPLSGCDAISRAVGLAVSDTRHASAGGSGPVAWELGGGDQWITASIEIMRAPGE